MMKGGMTIRKEIRDYICRESCSIHRQNGRKAQSRLLAMSLHSKLLFTSFVYSPHQQ